LKCNKLEKQSYKSCKNGSQVGYIPVYQTYIQSKLKMDHYKVHNSCISWRRRCAVHEHVQFFTIFLSKFR